MWALGGRHLQELHVLPQRLRWVLSSSGALINQRGFSSLRHRRGAYARAAPPPRPGTDGHFLPLPRPGTGTRVPGTVGTLKPPAPEARQPSALCQAPSRLSGAGAGGPRAGQRLGAGPGPAARLGSARHGAPGGPAGAPPGGGGGAGRGWRRGAFSGPPPVPPCRHRRPPVRVAGAVGGEKPAATRAGFSPSAGGRLAACLRGLLEIRRPVKA